jgi:hypothetical protein
MEHWYGCSWPDLLRRRQQSLCFCIAHRKPNTHAYFYRKIYTYADANSSCDCNANWDCNDYANRNAYHHAQCYTNSHAYGKANAHCTAQRNAEVTSHSAPTALATRDTHCSPEYRGPSESFLGYPMLSRNR